MTRPKKATTFEYKTFEYCRIVYEKKTLTAKCYKTEIVVERARQFILQWKYQTLITTIVPNHIDLWFIFKILFWKLNCLFSELQFFVVLSIWLFHRKHRQHSYSKNFWSIQSNVRSIVDYALRKIWKNLIIFF